MGNPELGMNAYMTSQSCEGGVEDAPKAMEDSAKTCWWSDGWPVDLGESGRRVAFYVHESAVVLALAAVVIFLLVFFRRKDAVLRSPAALKDLSLKDGSYSLLIYHPSSGEHTTGPSRFARGGGWSTCRFSRPILRF